MMEVNSFWHGAALSNLERLCLSSFVTNGVRFCLYVYDEPLNLPDGVVLKDANEIVDRSRLFFYQAGEFNLGSVSGFSNLFRYQLLHQRGGWWTDTDVCCLSNVPDESGDIYFGEASPDRGFLVGTALFRSEADSRVMRYCLERFAEKDVARIVHGETGPVLLTAAIVACGKQNDVRESTQIFPVPWWEYERLFFDEEVSINGARAVHFWNAKLSFARLDKNLSYPPNSLYERLKRKYLPSTLLNVE